MNILFVIQLISSFLFGGGIITLQSFIAVFDVPCGFFVFYDDSSLVLWAKKLICDHAASSDWLAVFICLCVDGYLGISAIWIHNRNGDSIFREFYGEFYTDDISRKIGNGFPTLRQKLRFCILF